MTPARQFKKLEARAVRATLHPVLVASLAELEQGPAGVTPAAFLSFLAELAHAALNYKKGGREHRRELRRIVFQPRASDAEFLRAMLTSYLTPPGPTCPGMH